VCALPYLLYLPLLLVVINNNCHVNSACLQELHTYKVFKVVGSNLIDPGQTVQNVGVSGLLGYDALSLGERFPA
jgi:hypothetical protein